MASKIKVDQIEGSAGSSITIPSGQTLTIADGLSSSSLPTVPVSKGGTGLTSLGSAGQAIKVNSGGNALEFGSVAGGKVLQVKQDSLLSQFQTTSLTFVASGLDIDFTPSATSSKVLISFMLNNYAVTGNTNTFYTLYRDGTNLGDTTQDTNGVGLLRGYTSVHHGYPMGLTFLDTPNSNAQIHYEVYVRTNSGTLNVGGSGSYPVPNYIQCLEIGV